MDGDDYTIRCIHLFDNENTVDITSDMVALNKEIQLHNEGHTSFQLQTLALDNFGE